MRDRKLRETDYPVTEKGRRDVEEGNVVDGDCTGYFGMREEVKEGLNEGGFSGAGAADDGDFFAGGDGEGDIFEDGGCSGWENGVRIGGC